MATYSRSQTTTQTSQSAAMPSMDISSLLVKTMENVMNDKEDGDKDFEKIITDAINNSDLLKDKTKNDTNKELTDLLKDKKNSDKELSNLLKDTNKNEKKKGTVKSDSDKITNTLGKIVSGGIIGSTIAGIMGSKGIGGALKGAVSGAVTGTGKVAGGLVSGVGNIGGSAIAGIGKLFGPVGGVIGKAVGTAVATPFKLVGGTITAAIGGLGKLLSMPLKELVTKGVLIVGVLSQLFVFLEGLMAKFIAEKDIKWIDFMSKLKSQIATIPDRLKLSLEQLLSKVRIMGMPIFGSLSKDEKKEYKALQFDEDLREYSDTLDAIKKDEEGLDKQKQVLSELAAHNMKDGGASLDMNQFDLNSEEGRQAYKQMLLSNADYTMITPEQLSQSIDEQLAEYKDLQSSKADKEAYRSYLEQNGPNSEKIQRYLELKDMAETPRTDEYYKNQRRNIDKEQEQLQEEYFAEDLYKYSEKKGGLTEYQQDYADSLHAGSVATVKEMYAKSGETLTTRDATGAERFLKNQYKEWIDSWGKMFKDFKQDIGINITQKQEIPNPNR